MKTYEERVYAAWLSSPMLPPEILKKLLEQYRTAEAVYHAFHSGEKDCFDQIPGLCLNTLRKNGNMSVLDFYQSLMERHQIQVLLYGSENFPENLLHISDPPCILFYQGTLSALCHSRKISFVGSRRASYKGLRATKKLAQELSERRICVVSGLARGIDAASHEGCLLGGSPTIAVLGCGLDNIYPRENAGLRQQILDSGGVILSEFAPGEKPFAWHFPIRNRIISGLGDALVVMEARKNSGSLITVQWALDQGKDVFAYPGDPEMPSYHEGSHQLLREGARFFVRVDHILEDLKWLDNLPQVAQNTTSLPDETAFSEEESRLIDALRPGPLGMDELCFHTGYSAGQIMGLVSLLQIRGIIEALPGKLYQLKTSDSQRK